MDTKTKHKITLFGPGCLPSVVVDEELAAKIEHEFDEGVKMEFRDENGVRLKVKGGSVWALASEDIENNGESN